VYGVGASPDPALAHPVGVEHRGGREGTRGLPGSVEPGAGAASSGGRPPWSSLLGRQGAPVLSRLAPGGENRRRHPDAADDSRAGAQERGEDKNRQRHEAEDSHSVLDPPFAAAAGGDWASDALEDC
jgi:hypothetical protein